MIHPSNLFRSDSRAIRNHVFSAPTNTNLGLNNFDCGLHMLPCLSSKIHKFATIKVYMVLVFVLVFLYSSVYSYFNGTSQVWKKNFRFDNWITDWLLHGGEIFAGIFAVLVSYWGNRIHRSTWLGTLCIFYVIVCWMLIIPESHQEFEHVNITKVAGSGMLCSIKDKLPYSNELQYDDGHKYISLGLMITYQLFYGLLTISIFSHGISFIDDHISMKQSTAIVCTYINLQEFGKYTGRYLTLIPMFFNRYIFISCTWIVLTTMIFIIGIMIAMFPKWLPTRITERGVALLLLSSNNREQNEQPKITSVVRILKRIFTNPALMLNITAVGCLYIGLTNFDMLEYDFFRAKLVNLPSSKLLNVAEIFESQHFASYIIEPFTMMYLIIFGFLIFKFQPHIKYLVGYIIGVYIFVASLYTALAFLKCEDKLYNAYGIFTTYCNYNCQCDLEDFNPVCAQNTGTSYYSACFAGCKTKNENGYFDCLCVTNSAVMPGSCNQVKCNYIWFLAQITNSIRKGLISSAFAIHLIISLRVISEEDKAIVLGIFLTFIKLVPYLPFKIFYNMFKDYMCYKRNMKYECTIFKDNFAMVLSLMTTLWILIAAVISLIMIFKIKYLNIYYKKKSIKSYDDPFFADTLIRNAIPNTIDEDVVQDGGNTVDTHNLLVQHNQVDPTLETNDNNDQCAHQESRVTETIF